jgi:hypothetical protein
MHSLRIITFLFVLSLFPQAIFAGKDSTFRHEIDITGLYFLNADALTNLFASRLYLGGRISENEKNQVDKRLRYINRFGGDFDYGISWSWSPTEIFGKKNIRLTTQIRDRLHIDGIFSADLFRLAFYGNKSFAGKTADLGNLRLNQIRYQQLNLGMEFMTDSSKNSYGFSLSLIKGENFLRSDVKRASLYTSPDGTFMDLDIVMEAQRSDTAKKTPLAFNGIGGAIDLFWEMPYLTRYNEGILTMQLSDFGFIRWNQNSEHYRIDSSYHYAGINVPGLLNVDNSLNPFNNPDSVFRSQVKYSREPVVTPLPCVLSILATTYIGKKYIIEKGINYRFFANARPFYYLGAIRSFREGKFSTGINISYGGYGRLNGGLSLEYKLNERFKAEINSYYISGYALWAKTAGQGAQLTLSGKF